MDRPPTLWTGPVSLRPTFVVWPRQRALRLGDSAVTEGAFPARWPYRVWSSRPGESLLSLTRSLPVPSHRDIAKNALLRWRVFIYWTLLGVFDALVFFFGAYFMFENTTVTSNGQVSVEPRHAGRAVGGSRTGAGRGGLRGLVRGLRPAKCLEATAPLHLLDVPPGAPGPWLSATTVLLFRSVAQVWLISCGN